MAYFSRFYLDKEKDMIVDLYREGGEMSYVLRTPNHGTGNLITNLATLCDLPLSYDEQGLKVIRGTVPCYLDGDKAYDWYDHVYTSLRRNSSDSITKTALRCSTEGCTSPSATPGITGHARWNLSLSASTWRRRTAW